MLETVPHRQPQIELTMFDHRVLAKRLTDTVLPAHPSVPLHSFKSQRAGTARGYDAALAMRLIADAGALEVGDGGFTAWTAELTGNAKERCLVSCIATERLTALTAQA